MNGYFSSTSLLPRKLQVYYCDISLYIVNTFSSRLNGHWFFLFPSFIYAQNMLSGRHFKLQFATRQNTRIKMKNGEHSIGKLFNDKIRVFLNSALYLPRFNILQLFLLETTIRYRANHYQRQYDFK